MEQSTVSYVKNRF